jgi:hypothetical protein
MRAKMPFSLPLIGNTCAVSVREGDSNGGTVTSAGPRLPERLANAAHCD